jgi:hypothetical protein
MSASAVRLMAGLPVGVLFPLGIPGLRDDLRTHTGAGLLYCLLIVAPDLDQWRGWVLLALATAVCAGIRVRLGPSSGTAAETPWITSVLSRRDALIPGAAVTGLAVAVGLIASPTTMNHYLHAALGSDRFALLSAGALTSIFLGGLVVEQVLRPHTETLRLKSAALPLESSEVKALVGAGMLIGWLERSIVFTLVMAGQPTAAVLTLTAKSVARFPALRRNEEGFAEYFLIGSLTSLVMSFAPALGTHWLLGIAPSG